MKAIAEELVSAFNTTITDYDAIDVAVKILENRFKERTTNKNTFKELRERKFPFHTKKFKKKTL
tara:strand:- start:50 stop:241 length:192 start_codon:yes stop_codon:yes gene_type:complete